MEADGELLKLRERHDLIGTDLVVAEDLSELDGATGPRQSAVSHAWFERLAQ